MFFWFVWFSLSSPSPPLSPVCLALVVWLVASGTKQLFAHCGFVGFLGFVFHFTFQADSPRAAGGLGDELQASSNSEVIALSPPGFAFVVFVWFVNSSVI